MNTNRMIVLFFVVMGLLTAGLGETHNFTLRKQLDPYIFEELNTAEKELSHELLKNSGSSELSSLLEIYLKPLHFHLDNLTVQVFDLRLSASDPVMEEINLDVLDHKMMPVVYFPWVEVNGKLKASLGDDSPHKCAFRLIQERIRGKGVVSLSVDLGSVIWSYFPFEPDSSSIEIKESQDVGPAVISVLNSSYFCEHLDKKLQRDISHQLSIVVDKNINRTLKTSSKMMSLPYSDEISGIGINNTENANSFIDSILRMGGTIIRGKYGDRIRIPDIKEAFSEKFLISFHGSFKAKEGAAIGISSVYRSGDVVFGYDNESLLHFYGTLGFKALRLYYNYYKAEVWGVGPSGSLDTRLSPLSVLVHIHLNTSSKLITLNKFKITNVGDLEVSLTGLGGMFNWLVSQVTTWVVGLYRAEVLQLLENQYEEYGQYIFSTYNIEELLNGGKSEN